jgi:hypothetical protein
LEIGFSVGCCECRIVSEALFSGGGLGLFVRLILCSGAVAVAWTDDFGFVIGGADG